MGVRHRKKVTSENVRLMLEAENSDSNDNANDSQYEDSIDDGEEDDEISEENYSGRKQE